MAAVLWLTVSLEWKSERRKQCRRGSAVSWGSSYTQPPSSPASMGSSARTSHTHLPHCQYWELCWRWCISGITHPAEALSAPLAIVFRAWEIHMLLIHYVSYIWNRKTLYGSRSGWNISVLTGGELHVVTVGGPHSSSLSSLCHAACAAHPGWPPVCAVLHKPPGHRTTSARPLWVMPQAAPSGTSNYTACSALLLWKSTVRNCHAKVLCE